METSDNETSRFQKKKILVLNKFFRKSIFINNILMFLTYVTSITFLIILLNNSNLDDGMKISLVSMIITFILTMSKSIIDKTIQIIQYIFSLLSEEQRGLNKNIGVEIDKIEFENLDSVENAENKQ